MPYNVLARRINKTAVEHGFWESDRDLGEMLMLAISEVAEALEQHRENKPAVWYLHEFGCKRTAITEVSCSACNSKPEGYVIELADCIIRCCDTLYSYDMTNPLDISEYVVHERLFRYNSNIKLPENFGGACKEICRELALADNQLPGHLSRAIVQCEELISRFGYDPMVAMEEKMQYNDTRPYKHGKAY